MIKRRTKHKKRHRTRRKKINNTKTRRFDGGKYEYEEYDKEYNRGFSWPSTYNTLHTTAYYLPHQLEVGKIYSFSQCNNYSQQKMHALNYCRDEKNINDFMIPHLKKIRYMFVGIFVVSKKNGQLVKYTTDYTTPDLKTVHKLYDEKKEKGFDHNPSFDYDAENKYSVVKLLFQDADNKTYFRQFNSSTDSTFELHENQSTTLPKPSIMFIGVIYALVQNEISERHEFVYKNAGFLLISNYVFSKYGKVDFKEITSDFDFINTQVEPKINCELNDKSCNTWYSVDYTRSAYSPYRANIELFIDEDDIYRNDRFRPYNPNKKNLNLKHDVKV
jgi:hypothetical protein